MVEELRIPQEANHILQVPGKRAFLLHGGGGGGGDTNPSPSAEVSND